MFKLFIFSFILVLPYGCENLNEATNFDGDIYQGFRFEYDEEVNQTNVEAVFRLGSEDGAKITLSPPALLMVNDDMCNTFDESKDYPYELS